MAEDTTENHTTAIGGPRKNAGHVPQPISYSIKGAMVASRLGRSTIFQLLADGRLARVKVGKRTLVPRASLEALLSGDVK